MHWVERERSQHREHVLLEVLVRPGSKLGRQVLVPQEANTGALELGQEHVCEHAIGGLLQAQDELADLAQLLLHAEPVRRVDSELRLELLVQARDSNHEELVEVRAEKWRGT